MNPGDIRLKERLRSAANIQIDSFNDFQKALASCCFNYYDVMCGKRTPENASQIRDLSCLHAVNHILKGRDKVLKNNDRAAHSTDDLNLRDQGFTRPKILVMLETRQMCAKYAESIVSTFQPDQQENKQRFTDAFTAPINESRNMPVDYQEMFEGNNDNNFLVALKFTRKAIKFYSSFYSSDIILASPLGLRRVIENEDAKKRDHDFLSSIEVVIVDQADGMQMQNWENVQVVFRHLNVELKQAHDCDFGRVRPWYLDNHAKFLRQTLVFSAYITPELNKLFNTSMLNVTGKIKMVASYPGTINKLNLGIKQTFSRFDASSPLVDPDARFQYFTSTILPAILRLPKPSDGSQGVLIFIPTYYDFLRLRNFFATSPTTQDMSFGAMHDYTEVSDQRRARSHFLCGRISVLLYTQRAHHFFRLNIRGVKRLVFYGLPDNAKFYEELVGGYLGSSVGEGRITPDEGSVRTMFSKWDGLRLERVAGDQRSKSMMYGVGDTFVFV